jgi:PAS domain S-box-containing protein
VTAQAPQYTREEELAELRQRLREAEQLHRAISEGEVDAFVVGKPSDKRVLLLANAYLRYRELVERMQKGVVTFSRGGDILFANQRFSRMTGVSRAEMVGSPLQRFLTPEDWDVISPRLGLYYGHWDLKLPMRRRDGSTFRALLEFTVDADGDSTLVVTDLTRQEEIDDAEAAIQAIRDGEVDALVVGNEVVSISGSPAARTLPSESGSRELLQAVSQQLGEPLDAIHDAMAMLSREEAMAHPDSRLALQVIGHQVGRLRALAQDLGTIERGG